MRTLRELLATWENWSARQVIRHALSNARADHERRVLVSALTQSGYVDAVEVLRDVTELTSLLLGWRWQVVHAARAEGASWEQIGPAVETSASQAEEEYARAIAGRARHA